MMAGVLEQQLSKACRQLGVEILFDHRVQLGQATELCAAAYFPGIGPRNGMLVFKSFDDFSTKLDYLREAGFGYAVLEEPRPDEEFDLGLYREILEDWGWHASRVQGPESSF
ncbi:MAG: hypothetical protein L0H70_06910 [Xanthomonadales bacterium]|nr:hypothetical protein [Xanthomonadales bacterium]